MVERSHREVDADVRAWLRGAPGVTGGNRAGPEVGRVAEFVLDQPMADLVPMVRDASPARLPPPPGATERTALDVANRAVALSFARFRLGSPERPGWPGFGESVTEQRALVRWAEVTATRAPGFAEHLLGVIDTPKQPELVRHARIVVLAATGRVEEARLQAVALARDWLKGPPGHDVPAEEMERLLASLPPDEELAALRQRVRDAASGVSSRGRGPRGG